MRPDRLAVVLRPRNDFEAMDLGFALAREHAAAWWQAWQLLVLPLLAVLVAVDAWLLKGLVWPSLLVWWLKPCYDLVLLAVFSHAVFGARPSPAELRTLLRRNLRLLPGALTWRRLSLSRSFTLPVYMLEGVQGETRRTRIAVLRHDTTARARLLTICCVGMELTVFFGLYALLMLLWPDLPGHDTDLLASPLATDLLYVVAITVVEPFYVAAGFALYLNRRTWLEAWDIDVALRRISARRAPPETSP